MNFQLILAKTTLATSESFLQVDFFLALGFPSAFSDVSRANGIPADATLAVPPALKGLFERPASARYWRLSCRHLQFSGVKVSSSGCPELFLLLFLILCFRKSSVLPEFRGAVMKNLPTVDADANAHIVRRSCSVGAAQSFTNNTS